MKYSTPFHLISDITKKNNIKCVLIGGFAVNYYKVSRQTADIDFLITEDDFDEIAPTLKREGYIEDYRQDVFVKLTTNRNYFMDIDFMFIDKETLGKIMKEGKEVAITRQKFIIPCLNHLIALKLHSIKYNPIFREDKDLLDIVELVRVNRVDIRSKSFKGLCLKYGTSELYSKIIRRVK